MNIENFIPFPVFALLIWFLVWATKKRWFLIVTGIVLGGAILFVILLNLLEPPMLAQK